MKRTSRRDFLKLSASLAGHGVLAQFVTNGLFNSLAQASDAAAKLVVIRVRGAMDSVLGLHPYLGSQGDHHVEDLFLGYSDENPVLTNVDGTAISLGPAAAPVAPYARQMAIVRGIFMGPSDLGHPFALHHATSGRSQDTAPHGVAYVAQSFARKGIFMVTNSPLQRGVVAPFPMTLTSILNGLADGRSGATRASRASLYADSRLQIARYQEFLDESSRVDRFVEIRNAAGSDAKHELNVILAALVSGLARVAQFDFAESSENETTSLDTHTMHEANHLRVQKTRWTRVAKFLDGLKSHGILDDTLVVVVTEFNRTPGMNANGGKDHNYQDNAVALFGRGVNGGTVVGDRNLYVRSPELSVARWAGKFIDFGVKGSPGSGQVTDIDVQNVMHGQTLSIPKNLGLIRPGDVWTSIMSSINPSLLSQMSPDARIIPNLFVG